MSRRRTKDSGTRRIPSRRGSIFRNETSDVHSHAQAADVSAAIARFAMVVARANGGVQLSGESLAAVELLIEALARLINRCDAVEARTDAAEE